MARVIDMASYSCHLCQAAVLSKHAVAIFGPTAASLHLVDLRASEQMAVTSKVFVSNDKPRLYGIFKIW